MKYTELKTEEICQEGSKCPDYPDCNRYHPNEFCLICQERLGDKKVYIEIHGKNGWSLELNLNQEFICWSCVEELTICLKPTYKTKHLTECLTTK